MLHGKAVMAWEGAADKCSGCASSRPSARPSRPRLDAHNAEHCGPWDQATDHTQRLKAAGGVSATERDNLSVKAEVAWREAFVQCRGSSQNLARGNADALARERGTPLSPQALAASAGWPRRSPSAKSPAWWRRRCRYAALGGGRAGRRRGLRRPPKPMPGPERSAEEPRVARQTAAPGRPPGEVVLVAGDTTYRGASPLCRQAAGERYRAGRGTNGEPTWAPWWNGRKHGKGPLQLGRRPVVRGRLGG